MRYTSELQGFYRGFYPQRLLPHSDILRMSFQVWETHFRNESTFNNAKMMILARHPKETGFVYSTVCV